MGSDPVIGFIFYIQDPRDRTAKHIHDVLEIRKSSSKDVQRVCTIPFGLYYDFDVYVHEMNV
jgi:hypothetical protein